MLYILGGGYGGRGTMWVLWISNQYYPSSINRNHDPRWCKNSHLQLYLFLSGARWPGMVQPRYKGWRADRPLTGAQVTMAATPAALLLATLALALTHGAHVEHEHQPEVTSVLTNIGLQQGWPWGDPSKRFVSVSLKDYENEIQYKIEEIYVNDYTT